MRDRRLGSLTARAADELGQLVLKRRWVASPAPNRPISSIGS